MDSARGFSADQVVEILAPGATIGYGSGYYLGRGLVLTARHVVEAASTPLVRFGTGPAVAPVSARVAWAGSGQVDLAFLELRSAADGAGRPAVLEWGYLTAAGPLPGPVMFSAVGFPRARAGYRADGRSFRDTLQVSGTVRLGSYRKTGQLDLAVTDQAMDRQLDWKGMSGAAVFVHDFLVGVVVKAAPAGNELVAVPVAAVLGDRHVRLREFESGELERRGARESLRRRGLSSQLAPACRRPYLDTVTELAARCPDLRGRDRELSHLRAWLTSSAPYALWSGMPWAGKTALAARLAADPPPGVDVVSFFVSSARGAHANRLWQALADQLAALVHEPAPADGNAAFEELWRRASQVSQDAGRRLLLLIDGVDELQERHAVTELMTRLPHHPLPGTYILLFTRPHPQLESTVPPDHPLRSNYCDRIELDPSPDALGLRDRARFDLESVLDAGGIALRVLLLIARTGPVSEDDIRQAIAWPNAAADQGALHRALTDGPSGRMLRRDSLRQDRPRLVIGHDTLRDELLERSDAELAEVDVRRLLALADGYAARGWPDETPDFLLEGYPSLLAQRGDTRRLTAVILSPRWVELARSRTRTALTAVTALHDALAMMAGDPSADLASVLLMAAHIAELDPPPAGDDDNAGLIDAWIMAGEVEYAEHMATCLADPARRAGLLGHMASLALDQGSRDRAGRLLNRAMESAQELSMVSSARAGLLLQLLRLAQRLGRIQLAAELSAAVWALLPLLPADQHAQLWLDAAERAAAGSDVQHVRATAAVLAELPLSADARGRLAAAAAAAGDDELAARLESRPDVSPPAEDQAPEPPGDAQPAQPPQQEAGRARAGGSPVRGRVDKQLEQIRLLITQGDYDGAAALISTYEHQPATVLDLVGQGKTPIIWAAIQAAQAGGPAAIPVVAAAQRFAQQNNAGSWLEWRCRVGAGLRSAHGPMPEPAGTFLADITEQAARHGQLAQVLRAATVNPDLEARTDEFSAFALGAARAGDAVTAARLLTAIRTHSKATHYAACYQIAQHWAMTDRWREAIDLVRDFRATFEPFQVRATSALTAIRQGDLPDGLSALMECAAIDTMAFSVDDLLAAAAVTAAEEDHWPLAATLAANLESDSRHAELTADLAVVAHCAGDPESAGLLLEDAFSDAAELASPADCSAALASAAMAALECGEPARARKGLFQAARLLTGLAPNDQANGLVRLAEDACRAGDTDLAGSLLHQAAAAARLISDGHDQAEHLAAIAIAAYQYGPPGLAAALATGMAGSPFTPTPETAAEMAAAARAAGDVEIAATVLAAITAGEPQPGMLGPLSGRSRHLTLVAAAAAGAGFWPQAEAALAGLPPGDRIDALAELAGSVCRENPGRARQLIVRGLLLGITPRLLAAASQLEPSLAVPAAGVLLARSRALSPPMPRAYQ